MKTQAVHSRFAAARRILLFWTFFIGLGAVGGACAMLLDPSGKIMGMEPSSERTASPIDSGAADETDSRRRAFPVPYGTHPAPYRW